MRADDRNPKITKRVDTTTQGDRGSLALNAKRLILAAGGENRHAGPTKITTTFYQQPDPATIGLYAENTVTGDELDRWEVGEFIDLDTTDPQEAFALGESNTSSWLPADSFRMCQAGAKTGGATRTARTSRK